MKTKIRNKYTYIVVFLIFGISLYITLQKNTKAEQMGSSPDSGGAESILVGSYNRLVSKGANYGSSSSPDETGNYGTYWNRIIYSATWEPDGTATEQDVLSNKTFYSGLNNRTIRTGTFSNSIDYSQQQYVQYDDYHESSYKGEESTWINTNSSSGNEVWYDTRTGLYWARSEPTTLANSFSSPSTGFCSFFTTTPRGSYDGSDADCGAAINACGTLSLASTEGSSAKTDWYLPTQKELDRAYIDGIYNKTSAPFTTTRPFWSSTESSSSSTNAWSEYLHNGNASTSYSKTSSLAVRCVRRD